MLYAPNTRRAKRFRQYLGSIEFDTMIPLTEALKSSPQELQQKVKTIVESIKHNTSDDDRLMQALQFYLDNIACFVDMENNKQHDIPPAGCEEKWAQLNKYTDLPVVREYLQKETGLSLPLKMPLSQMTWMNPSNPSKPNQTQPSQATPTTQEEPEEPSSNLTWWLAGGLVVSVLYLINRQR